MLEVAQKYLQLKSGEYYKCFGKVDKVVGLTIESIGPKAKLNDLCMIFLDKERRDYVMSEVVGFKDSHIILMPFDNVEGVGVGCIVENTGHPLTVAVGDELLGHTVDGIGRVTDCDEKDLKLDSEYPIEAPPPDPMSREIISDVLPLGVKAVDGLITVGKGQRIGIFAGSGVGNKMISIVEAGTKYIVVSIGKDDVNYLTELKEEELKDLSFKDPQSMMQNPESFSAIMDKLKEKYSNRSRHE